MNLRQKLEEEMKRHEKEMKRCEEQMMKLFFTKPVREKLMQTDEDKLKKLADVIVRNYDRLIELADKKTEPAASDVPKPQTETHVPGGMAGGAAYGR